MSAKREAKRQRAAKRSDRRCKQRRDCPKTTTNSNNYELKQLQTRATKIIISKKMMLRILQSCRLAFALLALTVSTKAVAQNPSTFQQNGVFDERDGHYAFTNATIYVSPEKKIEKATLIIKKGKVVAVGAGIAVPKDAVSIDLGGKYIYPSFIDLYSNYGLPEAKAIGQRGQGPQMESNQKGAFAWNEALKSHTRANEVFRVDAKKTEELQKIGFGAALTHNFDGMARGAGALVLLGNEREHDMIINPMAAAHFSFSKGTTTQDYPSSLMGGIALMRQTQYDVQYYKANPTNREYNISIEKWIELEKLPAIFDVNHRFNILRADKLGDEFGIQYIFKGGGDEYQRIDAIKATKGALIVPINFPLAYDVKNPYDAQQLHLSQLLHWELAPSNPAQLAKAGIDFCITQNGTAAADFISNLRRAYQAGLSEKDLLKALTTTPARLINADKQIGTLEVGKFANFFIASANILSEKSSILHHWVNGKAHAFKDIAAADVRGSYEIRMAGATYLLELKSEADAKIRKNAADKGEKATVEVKNQTITLTFSLKIDTTANPQPTYRLSGSVANPKNWTGKAVLPDGTWADWSATQTEAAKPDTFDLVKLDTTAKGAVIYPFVAYGKTEKAKAETVVFKNATVWTGENDGILTETDVLIENGKIKQVGKNIAAPAGAKTVDATGKHLTAGIIDEHSHICISAGVNEGTQASSAEVRIGDVLNADDVNMYRQLAGGVTAAQLLHGSANPIGGQSAMIKFRWGSLPEELKIADAPGFIKFALGENVKQANWGDYNTVRFPQTRMGVEQVYEDYFTRAREYGDAIKKNGAAKVRRDLDLDAVLEILESRRFITCHSYVQSEITMLIRVAEKHKFKVSTFTHILEGYKVADKMKMHGVGASTFADWWAYKYEVIDAIPYNPTILMQMGVTTAINSDDAEMGRRLNQEAAKSVKYGNMTEHDAWKMVTINPAKLLRIDNQTGSIKAGKAADIVLWTDNPLSIYARPAMTFVDGARLFDLEEDSKMRQNINTERNRLIQKSVNAKAQGAKTQPTIHTHEKHYHCGDDALNGLRWE
jgi:imidazolonepropionase-like amidohydrolase